MKNFITALVLFAVFAVNAFAATIDTVPVGDPGNANNLADLGGSQKAVGAVSYSYRIGTYEVTNSQYVEFLNFKAASDPLHLYNTLMGSDSRGGILRSGASGNFSYTVKPDMGNKPVNFVTSYDAFRFANWLNNGQGTGSTETGAYLLLGGTPTPMHADTITRATGAKWFLPSENEAYKAAYYQPAAQGGDADNYWLYPTKSNSAPTIATAIDAPGPTRGDIANPGVNVANYSFGTVWNGQSGNVTTVGSAGPASASFYGTFDQGGNVWEWNEELGTLFPGFDDRGLLGGSWGNTADVLSSANLFLGSGGVVESGAVGFRVATVPEPSSLVLAAFGLAGVATWGWRRRPK